MGVKSCNRLGFGDVFMPTMIITGMMA